MHPCLSALGRRLSFHRLCPCFLRPFTCGFTMHTHLDVFAVGSPRGVVCTLVLMYFPLGARRSGSEAFLCAASSSRRVLLARCHGLLSALLDAVLRLLPIRALPHGHVQSSGRSFLSSGILSSGKSESADFSQGLNQSLCDLILWSSFGADSIVFSLKYLPCRCFT